MISEKQIAYHEAGHAVVARALGLSVLWATMYAGKGKDYAEVMTDNAAPWDDDIAIRIAGFEKDLVWLVAGSLAQRRCAPALPDARAAFLEALGEDFGDPTDERNAADLCMNIVALKHGATSRELVLALFEQAQREAEALLDAHWPAVARVAEALIAQSDLGPNDIEALIAERGLP